jgi:hypothetical protein
MEPTDAVKLVYQSVFGGGHLIADEASSLRRLAGERAIPLFPSARRSNPSDWAARAWRSVRTRSFPCRRAAERDVRPLVPRTGRRRGRVSSVRSACSPTSSVTRTAFRFSSAAFSDYLASYTAAGRPMVRHSETYRRAYRPAYRVVCGAYETLLPAIVLTRQAAASGKTETRVPLSGVTGADRPWAVATLARLFGGACVSVAGSQDAAELLIRF